jgi:flagellar FliL protein
MADEAAEATPKPAKKSGVIVGMLVNGIGIFALSLCAVVAGGMVNAKLHPTPEYKLDKDGNIKVVVPPVAVSVEHSEEAKAALFLPIDPPLVVNFEDGSAVRFLQIAMTISCKDQKGLDSAAKNMPLVRNNLLLLMSNRDYLSLMSRDGKEKLRQEALAEINAVEKKQGAEPIDDLLFTSFVVQ